MNHDTSVLLAILGMGAVTYFTRIFGYFLARRIDRMPPRVEQGLKFIPGTIIISIIAPQVLSQGWVSVTASLFCTIVALVSRNLVVVMITGVLYISFIRNFLPA